MASCSMASAACGFVVTPSVTNLNSSTKMMMFNPPCSSSRKFHSGRMVVRASEEAPAPAPPAEATEAPAPPAAKPPPIGPKRGATVSIA